MSSPAKEKLSHVPHQPGVYLHKDLLGSIIYVGKAKDLRKRLASYFTPSRKTLSNLKTRALIDSIEDFEFHTVKNEQEALLLECKLIKQYRPRYNVDMKDDRRFLLVKINLNEPWPRFQTTRIRKNDKHRYFGPFTHSSALFDTISYLNKTYGLRTCRSRTLGEQDYKHCNADIIKNCSAPCIGGISREKYLSQIEKACEILDGKGKPEQLKTLEDQMQAAAVALDFEQAARIRDVIKNFKKTVTPTRQFRNNLAMPSTVQPTDDLAELADYLNLPAPPKFMECFDISNISSTHIVAAMVRFKNGISDNNSYRRYRIKTVKGQDDFASMAEVVKRRYRRLLQEGAKAARADHDLESNQEIPRELAKRIGAKLPDLIIVDGGKGQLSAAVNELRQMGLYDYPIIGLAKQREEVFVPDQSDPIIIPHDRGALKLLQRIRDEAHRFANGYNELLMRKRVKESLLDDCPGVSPKRKELLIKTFGSVARLKKAKSQEIAALPGLSARSADAILTYLNEQ